jgi:hypothetical protein
VTDQPTLVAADLIRAAIADAVTINAGPLIDHAASGVLYALGMLDTPPVDGAPGPIPPGGNAEDCPRCNDPLLPYPWICPGHDARTAPDNPAVERPSEPKEPGTTASADGLREQYAAAIAADDGHPWDTLCPETRGSYLDNADAVLAVRDRRMEQLRRERDLAVAHDRQPYPTAWAYEQACKALETHRKRADDAEATLAAIQRLADRYPVGIDTAHLHAALDGQAPAEDPAEDIDDWGDKPPDETPGCTATLRMFETVIHCTHHRPGVHRGPLPNTASTHAWGDYAPGATPHNPDGTKETQ